jgi:hypothetical protein
MHTNSILTGKQSWWGCGNVIHHSPARRQTAKKFTNSLNQHIPTVMDSVDEANRCQCGPKVVVDGKEYPRKAEKAD